MITFQDISGNKKVLKKSKLVDWLQLIAKKEKRKIEELNYMFCSDEYLYEMNVQYLQHSTYTDIITFDNSEPGSDIAGDIFISLDRVAENAKQFQVTFDEELLRVMAHGLLHLCGYKDKKKSDSELMRKKENEALSLWKS